MRARVIVVALVLGMAAAHTGQAQAPLPGAVIQGLDAMRERGPKQAVEIWAGSWPGADGQAKRDQLIEGFIKVGSFAGKFVGYDVVQSKEITPHLRRIYLVLLYERQPVYLMVVGYKPQGTWMVTSLNFNTDAKQVFPASIVEPEQPASGAQ